MLRQRKKRQNHQAQCNFKQSFVPYQEEAALKQQSLNSSNLINQNQSQKMIPCQQIRIVSEKYMNQRHFIKTQRPYLLLKDQKNYFKSNKQNIHTKLSLHNLTINPKQNMFVSNVNMNQSFNNFNKLRKFSSLKIQRPKSVGSFQLDRNDVKILQDAVKRHDNKISASKALILFSQILKNQKMPIQSVIKKKTIGQNRYKSVNVLANKVLIIQKQQPKKMPDFGMKPPRVVQSSQTYRKKRRQDDFQLNGWESQQNQFWQDSNQKIKR